MGTEITILAKEEIAKMVKEMAKPVSRKTSAAHESDHRMTLSQADLNTIREKCGISPEVIKADIAVQDAVISSMCAIVSDDLAQVVEDKKKEGASLDTLKQVSALGRIMDYHGGYRLTASAYSQSTDFKNPKGQKLEIFGGVSVRSGYSLPAEIRADMKAEGAKIKTILGL